MSEIPALGPPFYSSAHYQYVILTHKGMTLTDYAANSLWGHRA